MAEAVIKTHTHVTTLTADISISPSLGKHWWCSLHSFTICMVKPESHHQIHRMEYVEMIEVKYTLLPLKSEMVSRSWRRTRRWVSRLVSTYTQLVSRLWNSAIAEVGFIWRAKKMNRLNVVWINKSLGYSQHLYNG